MTIVRPPPSLSAELGRQPIESAPQRNPFVPRPKAETIEHIDHVPVHVLARQFGSPLFVFSERVIDQKCQAFRKAFEQRHGKVQFAWSYKTNHVREICRAFKRRGWMADVASATEYERARGIGYAGSEMVVNGPAKDRPLLERALREGALVQIDNWDELWLVEEIASSLPERVDVGIRVCVDAGIRPIWTKFGFILASGEALEAARRVVAHPRLRLHTLHAHIGTYILAPEAYGTAARKLLALRDGIFLETGHSIPCINMGGGFPSDSLLHGLTGPAEQVVPRIDAYAEAICGAMKSLPADKKPLLRLESGRHLIDNAGYLLATIQARKGARFDAAAEEALAGYSQKERLLSGMGARVSYVVDAGINLLYTAAWFRIEASPAAHYAGEAEPATLFGPLCMSIDVIRESAILPRMQAGDLLVLHPVGAYNFNQSMQFIYERPAVVMIDIDGKTRLIRRRESVGDLEGADLAATDE